MLSELLLSLFLVWVIRYLITSYLTRRNMPPGPFPYPFVGNLPQMLGNPVHPFRKLAEKYGDIFTITLPHGSAVVLTTYALAKEARLERGDDVTGRVREGAYPWPDIFGEDLITSDYSRLYRFRRRVFVSAMHLFGSGMEQASERARHAVDRMMEDIEAKKGKPFAPKKLFESSILVQLWEWISSNKVELDDPVIQELSKFSKIVSMQAMHSKFYQLIPLSSYLPTQFNRDIECARQINKSIFPPEFRSHMDTYIPGVVRDLTDSFINAYEKEIAKENSKDIGSIDDIPGLMVDVCFAGSDTTSSSLAWLLLYLVRNPDVQKKIQKEIDDVVGTDRLPTWKDSKSLPYLQATLCEVQRASGLINRAGASAIRDTTIAGYHIPKYTYVLIDFVELHSNERVWPEPKKFKPERFLDSDGKFVGWSKVDGFLPFSAGRRECPGQSLAKVMMFTFASVLLQRYNIGIPEGEEIPTAEVSSAAIVMRPDDFTVVASERNDFKH